MRSADHGAAYSAAPSFSRLLMVELALRPETAEDRGFLLALYASVRADELARVPWSDEQKAAFVVHQFDAQHAFWEQEYAGTRFDLILAAGRPAGRLYVQRSEDAIHVVDVALAPEWRNQGLGGALLGELLREGAASGRRVTIHVEQFNPARRLYDRLGFVQRGAPQGVYLLMSREPA